MNPELHQRLKEIDRRGEWEYPADLDLRAFDAEMHIHKAALENIFGCTLKPDTTQDAAYLLDLFVQDQRYVNMVRGDVSFTQIVQIVCIRFSAFDRMFTIFGTELEKFASRIPLVVAYLENHSFKYVSVEELSAPYDGIASNGTGEWTWFNRFFDYL